MYLYRYSNIRFYWYTHPHHCISALIHDLLLSYNKNTVPRISHLLLIVGKAFWKTQAWHQMLSCFWHLQPSSQSISTFSLRSALHACSLCWALKTQVSGGGSTMKLCWVAVIVWHGCCTVPGGISQRRFKAFTLPSQERFVCQSLPIAP